MMLAARLPTSSKEALIGFRRHFSFRYTVPQFPKPLVKPPPQTQLSTKAPKFFNREKEIKYLMNTHKKPPSVNLITGPVNSGKSWIMERMMEELCNECKTEYGEKPHIVDFNMRQLPFVDVDSFVAVFMQNLVSWYQDIAKKLPKVKAEAHALGVGVGVEIDPGWEKSPPQLVDLLKKILDGLPSWSVLRGSKIPIPILYIDEVNLLRELVAKDINGQKVLKTLMTWFVSMTKEHRKFHVTLCSSDSFIPNWLANFIGNDRFNAIVIGHLSKEEAEKFYDTQLASNGFHGRNVLHFNELYAVCGGSMFLLHEMYQDYIVGGIHPTESFYIYQARMRLFKSLAPENFFFHDPLKSKPRWKKEHSTYIFQKLVESEGGYIYFEDVCQEIDEEIIESLIEYNIIHLRPYFSSFCKDLIPCPKLHKAIIIAESPVSLYAMKELVTSLQQQG